MRPVIAQGQSVTVNATDCGFDSQFEIFNTFIFSLMELNAALCFDIRIRRKMGHGVP